MPPWPTGSGGPRSPLQINAGVRALIGVEIAVEVVRVVVRLAAGRGAPFGSRSRCASTRRARSARRSRAWWRPRTGICSPRACALSGIGVGVPGAVDDATGLVRFAPNLGWRDVSLLPELGRGAGGGGRRGRAGAAAERRRCGGAGRVRVRRRRGRGPADLRELRRRRRRRRGAQRPPLHRRAGHGRRDRPHHPAGGRAAVLLRPPRLRRGLPRLARAGARSADAAPRGAAFLGVLLQNLWVTFEPRAIVVGGQSCQAHPQLLRGAIEMVRRYAESAGMQPPGGARRALWGMGAGGRSGGTRLARVPAAAPSGFEGAARARRASALP